MRSNRAPYLCGLPGKSIVPAAGGAQKQRGGFALVGVCNRTIMADLIEPETNRLPRSLYAETARPAVLTPPLRGDKRVGVVVVGGGFTGLSTALHLAQRGGDATVLEAREPGWGASGRNGGQVNRGSSMSLRK